jgi:hypothetical protein
MSELKVDKVSPRTGTYVSLNTVGSKNIIINGDMSIAQRGTTATGLGNGDSGYHTCDRWKFTELGAPTAEFTQTQSTDVPSGQGFATSLKMDCTTAQGSLASTDIFRIQQYFEGQNLQYLKKGTSNAESLTLSFWVKSNKTGTYTVYFYDNDNNRLNSKSYTINSASTWEKKTITIAGDTTGTLDNDSNFSLLVSFQLLAGTNYTSGTLQDWGTSITANLAVGQVNLADDTANEWFITGVQLEAGTSASDFEFLPFDTQLQRCLRYYEKFVDYSVVPAENANNPTTGGANGWIAFDVNNIRTPPISFKCEKRTAPTIVLYRGGNSTAGNMGWFNGSSWQNAGTSVPKITTKGFYGTYNSGGSFTQFNSYLMDFSWTADSEL